MADFIGGVQGSGKTYFALNYIIEYYEEYDKIYTNIDDINYRDIEELNPNEFKKRLVHLYDLQVNQKKSDFELLEAWGSALQTLIIIDEAHNWFGKKDALWTWFITYHRHLKIDLFLLSQNITLIHSDNRIFNNYWIAYPPVKQFNDKVIRYAQYISYPFKEESFVGDIKLKKKQEVFALYNSGGRVKSPKVLTKFFIYLALVVIALFLIFGYLLNKYSPKKEETPPIKKNSLVSAPVQNPVQNIKKDDDVENVFFTHIFIVNDSVNIQGTPINNLDALDLPYILQVLQVKILRKEETPYYNKYTVLLNKDRLSIFTTEKEEKKEKSFSALSNK